MAEMDADATTADCGPQKAAVPRKLWRRLQSYVWCDSHCCIHEANDDYYGEGMAECGKKNWRAVAVETADSAEEFE